MRTIDRFDDLIDLRDIISRVEHLEQVRHEDDSMDLGDDADTDRAALLAELVSLEQVLQECRGYGGDEQWRGDWYPGLLIRDSYFKDYAQELADDIGAIDANAGWPMSCIDWDQAAHELRMDYSSVEFDGVTYWYR